ncbi:MAG: Hcp family type VI secretion system effector [Luteolibacter sp.]
MRRTLRPNSLSRTLALVPPAVALVSQQADGAFNLFIKMENITGEVTTKGYEGYIKLESFQWALSRTISSPTGGGSTRETSAPAFSELTLSKTVDSSSTAIFLNAVGSSSLATVTLVLVDTTTNVVFYRLTLNDVLVSSQGHSGAAGSDKPAESISLNFTKIKIETFDSTGKTTTGLAGWDLTKNAKF